MPGATVVVRNTATNEERTTTTTDATGFHALPSLVPGTYNITITHPGFKKEVVANRIAEVSQSAQVDVQLLIGQASDSVTVRAEGAVLVETTRAEVAATIDTRLVDYLPLNGRDFFDLAARAPHGLHGEPGQPATQGSKSMNLALGLSQLQSGVSLVRHFCRGKQRLRHQCFNRRHEHAELDLWPSHAQQPPDAIEEMKSTSPV